MRLRLFSTLVFILFVIILLAIPASWLTQAHSSDLQSNDASYVIESMLDLLNEGPQRAATPVGTIMDIEDCWEIEDTRTPSESPMISAMRNGNSPLGYDAASNTFYCTLGMNTQDVWPELSLFADSSDSSLQIAWVDDYAYDSCEDAIREGYRYELIAYTDQVYDYFGIVFTGLPIVSIHTSEDAVFSEAYIPARISVSSAEHESVISAAQIHLRGGGSLSARKSSYRFELHDLSRNFDEKRAEGLLGMEADTDWLLLANPFDETTVRNTLCFDMWRKWNADTNVPMKLQDRLVEVFRQDEYMGIYQLLQRVQPEKELIRIGGNPLTDSVVRLVIGTNAEEKPTLNVKDASNMWVEYRYDAQNQPLRAFHRFMNYALLSLREGKSLAQGGYMDDEAFSALAKECIPVAPMMSYFLFSQVCGFTADNATNNLYIWLLEQDGKVVYHVSPWDMDRSLLVGEDSARTVELSYLLPYRMLNLNSADCRTEAHRIWQEKREALLSSQGLYDWIIGMEDSLNASGAFLRESEKWLGGATELSLSEMLYYTESRIESIERALQDSWPVIP